MSRCSGRGYEECDTCLNREHDPFVCDDCEDGDLYESEEGLEDLELRTQAVLRRAAGRLKVAA